jgi:hypothetical protein
MILKNMDGWRRLSPDDPLVSIRNATLGWRKHAGHGCLYVFEYRLPTSPGTYRRRYSMEMHVSVQSNEARITYDLPMGREGHVLSAVEEALVSLGNVARLSLAGAVQQTTP